MSATTAALRTYGKRQGYKRKHPSVSPSPNDEGSTPSPTPSKRRRTMATFRTPSPVKTDEGADTDVEEVTPTKQNSLKKSGNVLVPTSSKASGSNPPVVRDLSVIFDSISPSVSPSGTPTKLARRMLGRSKTDSSVDSQSSPRITRIMDRTSSLPNLPSSSPHTSTTPPPALPRPSTPLNFPASSSKKAATRTYAGKYRSFLVELPASSTRQAEDDFETRESYSSLRNRWGVDNSEDDPHPFELTSPTKTSSTISDTSPSRNGKGKSKSVAVNPPHVFLSGMANPLKSISELRNKGESRRFLDEVGYLFEGLDPKCGIGLRRSSALEINTKLCSPEFTRKAKAADFYSRTWDLFHSAGAGKGEDQILDILLVFFLALVARDPSSLAELADRPSIPRSSPQIDDAEECVSVSAVLIRILDTTTPDVDPLFLVSKACQAGIEFKMAGVSKKDEIMLLSIHKVLTTKSNLFPASSVISQPLLITYILQSLPPSSLSPLDFPIVLTGLRHFLSPSISSTLRRSLSKSPDVIDSLSYECILYHLRLVETYLLGQWDAPSEEASQSQDQVPVVQELQRGRDDWMAEDLLSLCVCCELKTREDNSEDLDFSLAQKCFDLVLRVLVSLTHKDEQWGQKVLGCELTMGFILRTIHRTGNELHDLKRRTSDSSHISSTKRDPISERGSDDDGAEDEKKDKDAGSYALDTLCLALGLLTNLVQIVDDTKEVVRLTRLNPSCPLKNRSCMTQCKCSRSSTGLYILLSLYDQQTQTQREEEDTEVDVQVNEREAEASFLRGHLAVLFGLLMMHSPENQAMILDGLKAPISPNSESSCRKDSRPRTGMAGTRANGDSKGRRSTLAKLVNQAKEFVMFYTVVSRRLNRTSADLFGGGDDGETRNGKDDGAVAKEVLRFLEGLHDSVS